MIRHMTILNIVDKKGGKLLNVIGVHRKKYRVGTIGSVSKIKGEC